MSLVKVLSEMVVPSDVLQVTAHHIVFETRAAGAFISINTLEYMDAVVGSLREKRSGSCESGVSVSDIKDASTIKKGHGMYIKNNMYVYKSMYGWFVGVDDPALPVSEIKKRVESDISTAYPVYSIIEKRIEKLDPDRDPLTGCLTRKRFYKDMRGIIKAMVVKDIPLWIFYMDFNNFKIVNDTLGHMIGDEVLRAVAMEIRSIFMGYGKVYRMGGDEFVGTAFLLSREAAENIARRIEKVTAQAPGGIPVSVAVGVERFENTLVINKNEQDVKKIIDKYVSIAEGKMFINKEKRKNGSMDYVNDLRKFIKGALDVAKTGGV